MMSMSGGIQSASHPTSLTAEDIFTLHQMIICIGENIMMFDKNTMIIGKRLNISKESFISSLSLTDFIKDL
jgi:hypothetical protein